MVNLANVSINGTSLATSGTVNSTGGLVSAINAAGIGGITASAQVVGAAVTASTAGHTGSWSSTAFNTGAITASGIGDHGRRQHGRRDQCHQRLDRRYREHNTTGTGVTLTNSSGGPISVGLWRRFDARCGRHGPGRHLTVTCAVDGGTAFAAAQSAQTVTINGTATGPITIPAAPPA